MQVVVDGKLVDYVAEGSTGKPVVLFLHGWKSSSKLWVPLMRKISAEGFYCVAMDFPSVDAVWKVDDFTKFVTDFLRKIRLDGKIFAAVGHSFGGRVMLKDDFGASRLIFIDSAGIKPHASFLPFGFLRKIAVRVGKVFLPRSVRRKFASADYASLKTENERETFKNIINEDLSANLDLVKKPTLILWGARDFDTPVSDARIFAKKIAGSELVVFPNAGHYSFIDEPAETARLAIDFLGGVCYDE
ncbi:MAG: alpha/beta hydrolase [Candidatus Nomurabacteria bacterium]|jgi:pimeloyl-ACP methyl ester carboxylesterase|nr:alpha/beta hydrolase [Candidatus Nomurabacteria bacterium]